MGFVLLLAYLNGANDNFKGVATLFGSQTSSYRLAIVWATATTLIGSLCAFFVAKDLMQSFSFRDLLPADSVTLTFSMTLGTCLSLVAATWLGLPVSTTHALLGSLLGTIFVGQPSNLNLDVFFSRFLLPLLTSPVFALVASAAFYPLFRRIWVKLDRFDQRCVCLPTANKNWAVGLFQGALLASAHIPFCSPFILRSSGGDCDQLDVAKIIEFNSKRALDRLHFLSSGLVSFARGLNDTPKIAALLLIEGLSTELEALMLVAFAMAMGGLLSARRVAQNLSFNITSMNDSQGCSVNLVTSSIVILASLFAAPVSTTHVSCGALIGLGSITKNACWNFILKILLAWAITLPLGFAVGALSFFVFGR